MKGITENEQFVADLFDNAIDHEPMTVEQAASDLDQLRAEHFDVPDDLTPERFAEIWNGFAAKWNEEE